MSAFDYEKIAEEVKLPGPEPEKQENPAEEQVVDQHVRRILSAEQEYLPLTHEKYQGIAQQKGYSQNPNITRLKRVHYSHEAMIDVMIAEPDITQGEIATRFGKTQSWISIVIGSDAFQAALAKRRDDLLDPFLIATIEERFRGLANQSLQVLAEKLETTKNADLALKALDISSKALGFGARAGGQTNVQNNFVVQLPDKMVNSDQWAAKHSGQKVIQG